MILVDRVGHTFNDGVEAIRDVSLTLERGSFVVLVGQSGVGKSTLLRAIGGLIWPKSGTISRDFSAEQCGIVFQNHNLMAWRTVFQNVRLPLEIHNTPDDQRVQAMIELVGLSSFEHSYPSQLSGGMAQRVALARALIAQPQLLLLDEPFGALDALTRERMGSELLRIWQAHPVTVFMVTHSIREAVLLADEVLVMGRRPGTVTARVPIALPRPRSAEIESSPQFQTYTATIRRHIGIPSS